MGEMLNQINEQMATLSPAVQYWMNWMSIIFFASLFFVWKRTAARYVFISIILTIIVAMFVYHLSGIIHLLGVAHVVIWAPLFYYLVRFEIRREDFKFSSTYGVWLGLLMATIVVSLAFDVRDIALVAMGHK